MDVHQEWDAQNIQMGLMKTPDESLECGDHGTQGLVLGLKPCFNSIRSSFYELRHDVHTFPNEIHEWDYRGNISGNSGFV